ncbi:MAG: SAM-dependent methyltransferase [Gammaproteobacteria bacterium]|nr:SAM-dependent methyltransferase [Gammaproteobacteria bacterium]
MQNELPPLLPQSDSASAAHSAKVAAFIRDQIEAAGGSISFAEYMQHALYAPGLGYYTAGSTKFGEAGDFVTAPEVSPVFGGVLARQCAEVLAPIENGEILEYGAGSGRLAVDVLAALRRLDALPSAYRILEVSADLRERQEALLRQHVPDLMPLVTWLDSPPVGLRGVILANEVLDALPVERFVRRATDIMQQRVEMAGQDFRFTEGLAPSHLGGTVEAIEGELGTRFPDGYTSEVCLAAPGWIQDLSGAMQEGVAFLLDYGVSRREYYAVERSDGWLRCHFRHHAHNDPLVKPGIQDLTAWVDFTSVAEAAVAAGFEICGYSAQAQFLMAGGLDAEMRDFREMTLERQLALSGQVKTLTLPGEMGEHFKCMALQKGATAMPSGFGLADRTHTL